MDFTGFTEDDFNVFTIDGLENRMNGIITNLRPKFEVLGQHFAPTLTALTGDEMYVHIAKHLRRTKNPPKDTWVAFANNNRGYKMLPHFQIGLWQTHLFIWFAVIYEAPIKSEFGETLLEHKNQFLSEIPSDFAWSIDHTQPKVLNHKDLNNNDFDEMFNRLRTVKKAEILCGKTMDRTEVVNMNPDEFIVEVDRTFRRLIPLYQLAIKSSK